MCSLKTERSLRAIQHRSDLQSALTAAETNLENAKQKLDATNFFLSTAISQVAGTQRDVRKALREVSRCEEKLDNEQRLFAHGAEMISKLRDEIAQELDSQKEFKESKDALVAHRDSINNLVLSALSNFRDEQEELPRALNALPVPESEWEPETKICCVCREEFSILKLRMRHHCRICARNVCSKCSPNEVVMPPLASGGGGSGSGEGETAGTTTTGSSLSLAPAGAAPPDAIDIHHHPSAPGRGVASEPSDYPGAVPTHVQQQQQRHDLTHTAASIKNQSDAQSSQHHHYPGIGGAEQNNGILLSNQINNEKRSWSRFRVCAPCEAIYNRLIKARSELVAAENMKAANEMHIAQLVCNINQTVSSVKARERRIDELNDEVKKITTDTVAACEAEVQAAKNRHDSACQKYVELDAEIRRLGEEANELQDKIDTQLVAACDAAKKQFEVAEADAAIACVEAYYCWRGGGDDAAPSSSSSGSAAEEAAPAAAAAAAAAAATTAPPTPTADTFMVMARRATAAEVRVTTSVAHHTSQREQQGDRNHHHQQQQQHIQQEEDGERVEVFSAARCCREALNLDPDCVEAWLLLGDQLMMLRHPAAASTKSSSITSSSSSTSPHCGDGSNASESPLQCFIRAIDIMSSASSLSSSSVTLLLSTAWTKVGEGLMNEKNEQKAASLLAKRHLQQPEKALLRPSAAPSLVLSPIVTATTIGDNGEQHSDQECFVKALTLNAHNADAWTLLGITIESAQQERDAFEQGQQQQKQEKHMGTHRAGGSSSVREEKTDGQVSLPSSSSTQPPDSRPHAAQVAVTISGKLYYSGACCYKEALKCGDTGKTAKAWYRLGMTLLCQNTPLTIEKTQVNTVFVDARQCFIESVRCDVRHANAWNALGWVLPVTEAVPIRGLNYKKRHCYFEALRIDPTLAKAWNNLSLTMSGFPGGAGVSSSSSSSGHLQHPPNTTNNDEEFSSTVSVQGKTFSKFDCLIESLKHDENYAWSWYNLHGVFPRSATVAVNGKTYSKNQVLCEALRCDPNSSDAWNCLSWELAHEDVDKSTKQRPKNYDGPQPQQATASAPAGGQQPQQRRRSSLLSAPKRPSTKKRSPDDDDTARDDDDEDDDEEVEYKSNSSAAAAAAAPATAVICGRSYTRLEAVREAIRCDFNNADAWINYGHALSHLQRTHGTLFVSRMTRKLNSRNITPKLCFCEALRISPSLVRAWIDLAATLATPPVGS